MNFIIEYWHIIVALLALISVLGTGVFYFIKQPNNKQLEQVKQWLLFAVTQSEKELGDGTGQLKLRFVYDLFLTKFKWISFFMSFQMFSSLVDEALTEMRKLLETNKAVEKIVKGEVIIADKQ